jgi:hypothetical protein
VIASGRKPTTTAIQKGNAKNWERKMDQVTHNHDLLLVGSIPLETAEEVLESCGRHLATISIIFQTVKWAIASYGCPCSLTVFSTVILILKRYVPQFGLAAPCGLGRHKPEEIPHLLHEHVEALDFLKNEFDSQRPL